MSNSGYSSPRSTTSPSFNFRNQNNYHFDVLYTSPSSTSYLAIASAAAAQCGILEVEVPDSRAVGGGVGDVSIEASGNTMALSNEELLEASENIVYPPPPPLDVRCGEDKEEEEEEPFDVEEPEPRTASFSQQQILTNNSRNIKSEPEEQEHEEQHPPSMEEQEPPKKRRRRSSKRRDWSQTTDDDELEEELFSEDPPFQLKASIKRRSRSATGRSRSTTTTTAGRNGRRDNNDNDNLSQATTPSEPPPHPAFPSAETDPVDAAAAAETEVADPSYAASSMFQQRVISSSGEDDNDEDFEEEEELSNNKRHRKRREKVAKQKVQADSEDDEYNDEVKEKSDSRYDPHQDHYVRKKKQAAAKNKKKEETRQNDHLRVQTRLCPSYFSNPHPSSVMDVYNEYCGVGDERYRNVPQKGGFRRHYDTLKKIRGHDPVGGHSYPPYRVVRDVTRLAEQQSKDQNIPITTVLEKLNSEWENSGQPFWRYFSLLTGAKGRVPFSSDVIEHKKSPGKKKKKSPGITNAPSEQKTKKNHLQQQPPQQPPSSIEKTTERPRRRCTTASGTLSDADEQLSTRADAPPRIETIVSDPNEYYIEETAFLFHDPPAPTPKKTEKDLRYEAYEATVEILQPIPSPPQLPAIPHELKDRWTYDHKTRVLKGNFVDMPDIPWEDRLFIREMMQRDDVSVVTKGCLAFANPEKWDFHSVAAEFKGHPYHKFRTFQRSTSTSSDWRESDGFSSMHVTDYVRYIHQVQAAHKQQRQQNGADDQADKNVPLQFEYMDPKGNNHVIEDVLKTSIYMVDIEMSTHVTELDREFKENFKLKELLPGGELDLMNSMNETSRPFMGPNLYISPGGGFTHFHQDGFGTVDSGHFCLGGHNEVIQLRRLTERHKKNAIQIMNGSTSYDALYSLPHGDKDAQGERPRWPDRSMVDEWERMGYCPSVFVLEPNEFLHINKGRLHAFRKLTIDPLPENDCHAKLRADLVSSEGFEFSPICVSVAYDWMFRGIDKDGVNREVSAIIETAALCRNRGLQALATPETALLNLAMKIQQRANCKSSPLSSLVPAAKPKEGITPEELCRGILPSLRHIITRGNDGVLEDMPISEEELRKQALGVDMNLNILEESCTVDARGNDFYCKICHAELSNLYYHCNGCEDHLSKDFNICADCHASKAYLTFVQMHKKNSVNKNSLLNHTGHYYRDYGQSCPCRKGRLCPNCKKCTACSCSCHKHFTPHYRTISKLGALQLLRDIESIAGEDKVGFAKETAVRLQVAEKRYGEGHLAKIRLLEGYGLRMRQTSNDCMESLCREQQQEPHNEKCCLIDEGQSQEHGQLILELDQVDLNLESADHIPGVESADQWEHVELEIFEPVGGSAIVVADGSTCETHPHQGQPCEVVMPNKNEEAGANPISAMTAAVSASASSSVVGDSAQVTVARDQFQHLTSGQLPWEASMTTTSDIKNKAEVNLSSSKIRAQATAIPAATAAIGAFVETGLSSVGDSAQVAHGNESVVDLNQPLPSAAGQLPQEAMTTTKTSTCRVKNKGKGKASSYKRRAQPIGVTWVDASVSASAEVGSSSVVEDSAQCAVENDCASLEGGSPPLISDINDSLFANMQLPPPVERELPQDTLLTTATTSRSRNKGKKQASSSIAVPAVFAAVSASAEAGLSSEVGDSVQLAVVNDSDCSEGESSSSVGKFGPVSNGNSCVVDDKELIQPPQDTLLTAATTSRSKNKGKKKAPSSKRRAQPIRVPATFAAASASAEAKSSSVVREAAQLAVVDGRASLEGESSSSVGGTSGAVSNVDNQHSEHSAVGQLLLEALQTTNTSSRRRKKGNKTASSSKRRPQRSTAPAVDPALINYAEDLLSSVVRDSEQPGVANDSAVAEAGLSSVAEAVDDDQAESSFEDQVSQDTLQSMPLPSKRRLHSSNRPGGRRRNKRTKMS